MRLTKLKWAFCLGLGVLLGFGLAAQRSGLLRQMADAAQQTATAVPGGDKGQPGKQPRRLEPLESLPRPQPPFKGQIGRIASESKPDFPKEVKPPKDAPNVLLIMTDDVGFGAASTFGGPVPTPTFDKLAKRGLKYNRFHTTALCSPTRAALITGRNHHSCSTGVIMEQATGFPGYNSLMSRSCGTIAEILTMLGYSTAWFGKNHNVPDWHTSAAGPFTYWPTGLGFDYFYGFLGGDTNQWFPAAFENTKPIEPYHGQKDYHFDKDMADKAITWLRKQHALAPQKPWFCYYAPGTAHAPHHAPKEWIAKFKGKFDQGWDKVRVETLQRQIDLGVVPKGTKLVPFPHKDMKAWETLSADEKKVFARMMEVYAAALAHADHHIGRVIDAIEEMGDLDNTMIIFIQGDNGPSAEGTLQGTTNEIGTAANGVPEDIAYLLSMLDELGGPKTYGHYPVAWAQAMATPFGWMKQVASHFGGTRNGMVISWPKRIKDVGTIRRQFHHVIDIAPTILEAVGVESPLMINGVQQKPIEGVSMMYTFDNANAPPARRTQYFEMQANRALYHDGWIACTTPKRPPWINVGGTTKNPADDYEWELYNIEDDFSEAKNLAKENPKKLRELQDLWWAEAAKYNVLPLDDRAAERVDVTIRPGLTKGRNKFTYYPGMIRIPEGSAPATRNCNFSITADVVIPEGAASGVLATMGGRFGGWGLLLMDGKPRFDYAFSNQAKHHYQIAAKDKLTPGKHTIHFDFKYDGGGMGKGAAGILSVDGKKVAEGRIEKTIAIRFSLDETFDVGEDTGTPVAEDYADRMPFRFTGKLIRLVIDLPDAPVALNALQLKKLNDLMD
jgi:arylsulfatase A-like enzyme